MAIEAHRKQGILRIGAVSVNGKGKASVTLDFPMEDGDPVTLVIGRAEGDDQAEAIREAGSRAVRFLQNLSRQVGTLADTKAEAFEQEHEPVDTPMERILH